ncbi:ExeA family protein [Aeromonas caviae]|uniref:General secretion pathway protein GspA n=1 Tax=Aeromonas caviae TaxID=648 RepID=A0AAV4YGP3_AERCA|nr:ExeA family protein [Aeromonas caviae]BDN91021.1 general secretion pathway protein GspA [Aeromonas caviae]GJA30395.1 general secretion pathway protein GspA [Aeromonas caviae]GJA34830.1 general secretion pathway protein GspA [Aeromonas caviae]GJA39260.1 general secretion pathway protein GspA [Aeromonas caviae]GJA75640.1 general secretion pathway protein GspA [Aeromonas caviae]
MYTQFFGLSEPPFSISPNPKYLYMSERHGEALAHLSYGLQDGGGFVLLTGEVGTGKTTVSRCLLQQLPPETEIAYILNPSLTERDLLAAICDEYQLPYADEASLKQLFDLIRDHLLANLAAGKRSVVLVDEAQHLLPGVLEQLRLLTNLETDDKKLLQVVLIGQPELQQMLRQPLLRQLAQRITARYHLLPLSRQDVDAYVRFRLQVAGCIQPLFTPRAIQTLHRLSGGIPRLINLICDRALIAAFARGSHKIVHGDISQSAYEVSGIRDEGSWQSGLAVTLGGALLVAAGWWGWQFFGFFPARPLVKVEVPVKVDDTPEQQAQLTRAINQALEPDVAMQNLYKVWGYQAELEEATCDNAPRAGLRCQEGEASLAQLQALQYPALISLTDETGGLYYATLVSLGADKASLLIGNQSWQVDRQWLSDAWGGSYTLLWRMPRGNVPLIASNAGAAQVQWLDNALSRAMQQPDRKVSRFDATLKNKLQQFQREQGLTPDGIAGSNTLLRLNVASGEPMPRLEDESLRASTPVDLDSVADDETDPMVEEAS